MSRFIAYLLILVIFINITELNCQDERTLRKIYSGELAKEKSEDLYKKYTWVVYSDYYKFDLNGDNISEYFQISKKDGEDWFYILNQFKWPILKYRLKKWGQESFAYKLKVARISPITKVLILFFYEGNYSYINTKGTSSVYFISLDHNNLDTLKIVEGPLIFEEKTSFPKRYFKRNYQLKFHDYNKDGVKEVAIISKQLSYIYFYLGNGKWKSL